jgi:glucose/arabinose dehydrogenase
MIGPAAEPVTAVQLVPLAAGLRKPVYVAQAEDGRFYVAEQNGRVQIIEDGELLPEPFLDINEQLATDGSERGLLGLALHPDFVENGYFYVVYTNVAGDTEISRFSRSADDPNQADPESSRLILFIEQPYGNHNGGQLLFGPDGYLYIGLGDGGAVSDPYDNAQDVGTLLGTILRIDVDAAEPYAIPEDNPFVGRRGALGEVWAYGLRNPFAFSFDAETHDLYLSDVGQEGPEEINFQPAQTPAGVNYGWPFREGSGCYEAESCRSQGLQMPIYEYAHGVEGCAVIGGQVYRGALVPEWQGNYFYSDFCSGTLWTLRYDQTLAAWVRTAVYESGQSISAVVAGVDGELYLLAYQEGVLYGIRR